MTDNILFVCFVLNPVIVLFIYLVLSVIESKQERDIYDRSLPYQLLTIPISALLFIIIGTAYIVCKEIFHL